MMLARHLLVLAIAVAMSEVVLSAKPTGPGYFNPSVIRMDRGRPRLKLGLLSEWTKADGSQGPGFTNVGAMPLAVTSVNREIDLLPGYDVQFDWVDTQCDINKGMEAISEFWRDGYVGIIGPGCGCTYEGRLASALNMPMIDYACDETPVSDKTIYPTFLRTLPPSSQVVEAVMLTLKMYDWDQVAIVIKNNTKYRNVFSVVKEQFDWREFEILHEEYYEKFDAWDYDFEDPFGDIITRTKKTARIYLFLGEAVDLRQFAMTANSEGILETGLYHIIGTVLDLAIRDSQDYHSLQYEIETTLYLNMINPDYRREFKHREYLRTDDDVAMDAMKYVSVITGMPTLRSRSIEAYARDVIENAILPPFNGQVEFKGQIDYDAFYLFDAARQLLETLDAVINEGGDIYDGKAIVDRMINTSYSSKSGFTHMFDHNGDGVKPYALLNMIELPIGNGGAAEGALGMYPIGSFDREGDSWVFKENEEYDVAPVWQHGGKPPIDMPPCGFYGELCTKWGLYLGTLVPCGTILFFGSIFFYVYRKRQYEAALDSLVWKVDWSEVQTKSNETNSQGFSMKSMVMSAISVIANAETQQIFATIGTYRGTICAIHAVHKNHVDLTRAVRTELKMMRDMRHDNVCPFIGACIDRPHICILMHYCAKGSLQDILENEDIKLDSMFLASLIADLVKGIVYLHSSEIKSHGHLKSSNCVVDNRWVLQITDYGLNEFRKGQKEDVDLGDHAKLIKQLWTAPELLRMGKGKPPGGSPKGDIYSFAIILTELYTRHEPYAENDLELADILIRVKKGEIPPYRPILNQVNEAAPDCVLQAIRACWAEDPLDRPQIMDVRRMLAPLQKGLKPNILDNMIAIMERYTNNLEELVDERTLELRKEKTKTENLLHRMLPPSIASQLIKGISVLPETFDMVSIFFSDIVGFTALSAASTPIQVVNLLNDLYTLFDAIISNYDVYKVETIGDAYMLVSGLPIRNGDRHAGQICSAAYHLLEDVKKFVVPHRPEVLLKLRIGIHSGSCVAGVVGLTMPRYCLFGDTVNTSSRMESNGLALKIHISPWCKQVLDKLGGYILEERGLVAMKGKGEILTYWLTGQDPSFKITKIKPPPQKLTQEALDAAANRVFPDED